jgi:hypothetical protein
LAISRNAPHGTVLGHDILVTNKSLCIVSIVFYSINAIPVIGAIFYVPLLLSFALVLLSVWIIMVNSLESSKLSSGTSAKKKSKRGKAGITSMPVILTSALVVIFFVVDTELMIRRSVSLVKDGESLWTFGQVLAMIMVVSPLVEVVKQGINWYKEEVKRLKFDRDRAAEKGGDNGKEDEEEEAGDGTKTLSFCSKCQQRLSSSTNDDQESDM